MKESFESSGESLDNVNRETLKYPKFDPGAAAELAEAKRAEISAKKSVERTFSENLIYAKQAVEASYNKPSGEVSDNTVDEYNEMIKRKQEAEENRARYGENLNPQTAKFGFTKELNYLRTRALRMEHFNQKIDEGKISPKEAQKTLKQLEKDGKILSEDELKHYQEMLEMEGREDRQEEYGREKSKTFKDIQAIKKAHPIKFRQAMRKHSLSLPKEWDDGGFSLGDYEEILSHVSYLDKK